MIFPSRTKDKTTLVWEPRAHVAVPLHQTPSRRIASRISSPDRSKRSRARRTKYRAARGSFRIQDALKMEATQVKSLLNNLVLSTELIMSTDSLRRRASARNVSSRISLRWLIHIINSVDKTKLFCNTTTDAAPQFLYKLTPFTTKSLLACAFYLGHVCSDMVAHTLLTGLISLVTTTTETTKMHRTGDSEDRRSRNSRV